jgi:hypothetical protein
MTDAIIIERYADKKSSFALKFDAGNIGPERLAMELANLSLEVIHLARVIGASDEARAPRRACR